VVGVVLAVRARALLADAEPRPLLRS
jgi:hypothetical protein